eukprot:753548-Hanusia_phi.AAC.1
MGARWFGIAGMLRRGVTKGPAPAARFKFQRPPPSTGAALASRSVSLSEPGSRSRFLGPAGEGPPVMGCRPARPLSGPGRPTGTDPGL